MSSLGEETVISVRHWNDKLFSFRTTRDQGLRFENGQFVMMGLEVEGRPLLRAYSIASPNYADYLEFFSIKVPHGVLTSKLQHVEVGDKVVVSHKPTGTLLASNLLPGKRLYLLSTGTGLAPFMAIIQDPEVYERFEKIILVHGVRHSNDLAYADFIRNELPENEFFGEEVKSKLIYYPTVTRDKFEHKGRVTDLIRSGQLFKDIGLPSLDPAVDKAMICGNEGMLKDTCELLDSLGFNMSPRQGEPGDYAIEKAFAEK